MAALALAACGNETAGPTQGQSIAGRYILTDVTPVGSTPEPGGGTVTVIGGQLTLGPADPEPYTYPPSGVPIARSCVHQIPNGAMVDTANVVHMPDGSSYKLPRCGTGRFTLVLIRQSVAADGSSGFASDTTTGLYTWGPGVLVSADTSGPSLITLVDAGMGGSVTFGRLWGPVIEVSRQHVGPPMTGVPPEPAYTFSTSLPD